MLGKLLDKLFGDKPKYTGEQIQGLGYKTDGKSAREKVGKGKQRMLLDSTKLLLDNNITNSANPYEAERRIDNNVYQMFSDEPEDRSTKSKQKKKGRA